MLLFELKMAGELVFSYGYILIFSLVFFACQHSPNTTNETLWHFHE